MTWESYWPTDRAKDITMGGMRGQSWIKPSFETLSASDCLFARIHHAFPLALSLSTVYGVQISRVWSPDKGMCLSQRFLSRTAMIDYHKKPQLGRSQSLSLSCWLIGFYYLITGGWDCCCNFKPISCLWQNTDPPALVASFPAPGHQQ